MTTDFFHDAIQPPLIDVVIDGARPGIRCHQAHSVTVYDTPQMHHPAVPYPDTFLHFSVYGKPAPQGSKRTGGGHMMANGKISKPHSFEANKRTRPWRAVVRDAAEQRIADHLCYWGIADGPVEVNLTFFKPRPKYHYGTGKNADRLKPDMPYYCTTGPDVDKMSRAILDSMTDARVYLDDSQVVSLHAVHVYADKDGTYPTGGVSVTVEVLGNPLSNPGLPQ